MKMFDLGKSILEAQENDRREHNARKTFPTVSLNDAPFELSSKQVGDSGRAEIVFRISSKDSRPMENGTKNSITLEIQQLGIIKQDNTRIT